MNGGWRERLRHICYGRDREPLEPFHRGPILCRAIAWFLQAGAFLVLVPIALLDALDAPRVVGTVIGITFAALVLASAAVMLAGEIQRPTPLVLLPHDEEM